MRLRKKNRDTELGGDTGMTESDLGGNDTGITNGKIVNE